MNIIIAMNTDFAGALSSGYGPENHRVPVTWNFARKLRLVNFRLSYRGLFRGAT